LRTEFDVVGTSCRWIEKHCVCRRPPCWLPSPGGDRLGVRVLDQSSRMPDDIGRDADKFRAGHVGPLDSESPATFAESDRNCCH